VGSNSQQISQARSDDCERGSRQLGAEPPRPAGPRLAAAAVVAAAAAAAAGFGIRVLRRFLVQILFAAAAGDDDGLPRGLGPRPPVLEHLLPREHEPEHERQRDQECARTRVLAQRPRRPRGAEQRRRRRHYERHRHAHRHRVVAAAGRRARARGKVLREVGHLPFRCSSVRLEDRSEDCCGSRVDGWVRFDRTWAGYVCAVLY
jgi:hypothetical protein